MVFVAFNAVNLMAARPTVQTSNLTYNNLNCDAVSLNWTNGNGGARIIFVRKDNSVNANPSDGSQYSANPIYGQSTAYGPGTDNYVVYNASGTNFVKVTGLQAGATYHFAIYEHDNNGGSTEYLLTNPATISITTHNIVLGFTTKNIDSCEATNSYEFTNTSASSIPGLTYTFDFGDGTSTSSPTTHHFSGTGGYKDIKLIPNTSLTGCPNLYKKNVKVFPKKIGYIDKTTYVDSQCLDDNYYEIFSISPLQPFPMGVTYHWWFGDGTNSTFPKMRKKYKTSGTFDVMLELSSTSFSTLTGCKDTIFFKLTVLPSPVGNISINDTIQCLKGNRFEFNNPDNTLDSFSWSFGDNSSSKTKSAVHTYADTGKYQVIHVAYAKSGCKGRDTVDVRVLPNLNSQFSGLDTAYCSSSVPITLYPDVDSGYYEGYNIQNNQLIPDVPGKYTLNHIVSDKYCSDTSFKSFTVYLTPKPNLGRDTPICNILSYELKANTVGQSYDWSTGENTPTITVYQSGLYWVEVKDGFCPGRDSINLIFAKAPKVNIGVDTILCKGGGMYLNASSPQSTYLWSNGSRDSQIYAFQPGKYKVTVTNPCGTVEDSINIFFQNEYCDLFMANAFSPGNDLVNNVFMPRGRNITVTKFQIFNRWGELVFETDQTNVGWDGTYQGEYVQEGLYLWMLQYNTPNGPYIKKSNAAGQVLLIR